VHTRGSTLSGEEELFHDAFLEAFFLLPRQQKAKKKKHSRFKIKLPFDHRYFKIVIIQLPALNLHKGRRTTHSPRDSGGRAVVGIFQPIDLLLGLVKCWIGGGLTPPAACIFHISRSNTSALPDQRPRCIRAESTPRMCAFTSCVAAVFSKPARENVFTARDSLRFGMFIMSHLLSSRDVFIEHPALTASGNIAAPSACV